MSSPEGAASKVRILQAPDRRPSKNTRRRKFQDLFRTNPMNDPEPRQCGAKTRSGEPCRRSPAPGKGQCRLHGGAPGSGAPAGERNGAWKGGRYSQTIPPVQRHQAWKDYWAAKRAQNTALADIPDISEELQTYGRHREREYRSELRAPRVIMRCARCLLFEWGDIGER